MGNEGELHMQLKWEYIHSWLPVTLCLNAAAQMEGREAK